MKIDNERIKRALDKFKVPEIEIEYEFDPSQIKKCELCGSDAAVYENTHYAVHCSNPNCDRSLLGDYSPCWRTSIIKAILDWNEPGWDKLEGGAK